MMKKSKDRSGGDGANFMKRFQRAGTSFAGMWRCQAGEADFISPSPNGQQKKIRRSQTTPARRGDLTVLERSKTGVLKEAKSLDLPSPGIKIEGDLHHMVQNLGGELKVRNGDSEEKGVVTLHTATLQQLESIKKAMISDGYFEESPRVQHKASNTERADANLITVDSEGRKESEPQSPREEKSDFGQVTETFHDDSSDLFEIVRDGDRIGISPSAGAQEESEQLGPGEVESSKSLDVASVTPESNLESHQSGPEKGLDLDDITPGTPDREESHPSGLNAAEEVEPQQPEVESSKALDLDNVTTVSPPSPEPEIVEISEGQESHQAAAPELESQRKVPGELHETSKGLDLASVPTPPSASAQEETGELENSKSLDLANVPTPSSASAPEETGELENSKSLQELASVPIPPSASAQEETEQLNGPSNVPQVTVNDSQIQQGGKSEDHKKKVSHQHDLLHSEHGSGSLIKHQWSSPDHEEVALQLERLRKGGSEKMQDHSVSQKQSHDQDNGVESKHDRLGKGESQKVQQDNSFQKQSHDQKDGVENKYGFPPGSEALQKWKSINGHSKVESTAVHEDRSPQSPLPSGPGEAKTTTSPSKPEAGEKDGNPLFTEKYTEGGAEKDGNPLFAEKYTEEGTSKVGDLAAQSGTDVLMEGKSGDNPAQNSGPYGLGWVPHMLVVGAVTVLGIVGKR